MSRIIKKRNYIRVGKLLVVYSILACALQFTNHAYSQNIEKWIELSPMPTPRSELAATVSEGFIYVAGGLNEVGGLDAFEIYDIDTTSPCLIFNSATYQDWVNEWDINFNGLFPTINGFTFFNDILDVNQEEWYDIQSCQ